MGGIQFNLTAFRASFPCFQTLDPVEAEMYWGFATDFISNYPQWCICVKTQARYLNLMTAHIAALAGTIAAGDTPGIVTNATIDKISVSLQPPPERNQWQYWLNQTPYGQQLLALLQVGAVGGIYAGGVPIRSAFRGGGGYY